MNNPNISWNAMPSIRPVYDPNTRLWYAYDDVSAKSLAVLQRKLPRGVTIADYYPEGYGNVVRPRERMITLDAGPPVVLEREAPREAPTHRKYEPVAPWPDDVAVASAGPVVDEVEFKPVGPKRAYHRVEPDLTLPGLGRGKINWTAKATRDALGKLVEQGLTSRQIAAQFDCTPNAVIGACNRAGFQLKHKSGFRHS